MNRKFLLLCFLLFFSINTIFAQNQNSDLLEIIIKNADTIEFVKNIESNTYNQHLVGNVFLMYNEAKLFCDSAVKYGNNNTLEAFYNVDIIQGDTLHLESEYLKFSEINQNIKAKDTVILRHRDVTLHTNYLNYNLITEIATFLDSGKIIDNENTITSQKGIYNLQQKEAIFYNDVIIINNDYTIKTDSIRYFTDSKVAQLIAPTNIINDSTHIYAERGFYNTDSNYTILHQNLIINQNDYVLTGDSAFYDRKADNGEVFSNAILTDKVNDLIMSGNYMFFDRTKNLAIITDSAVLSTINETDSTFTHADTIKLLKDEADNTLVLFYKHAQFFQNTIQGRCDSMVYTFIDSTLRMYDEPVLWLEENQLTADTIVAFFQAKKIKHINLLKNAFIISKEDNSKFNQLKGRYIKGDFYENKLITLYVFGNGESIYYPMDNQNYIGFNHVRSSKIRVDFVDQKIQNIAFIGTPRGTLYPLKDTSKIDVYLPDFKWIGELKPVDKNDIFLWKVLQTSNTNLKVKKELFYNPNTP